MSYIATADITGPHLGRVLRERGKAYAVVESDGPSIIYDSPEDARAFAAASIAAAQALEDLDTQPEGES